MDDSIPSDSIPLDSWSESKPYEDLPYFQTSYLNNDTANTSDNRSSCNNNNNNSSSSHDHETGEDSTTAVSHGFFLGSRSIPNLTVSSNCEKNSKYFDEEDEVGSEEEDINYIYRSTSDPDGWIRQSGRSFKNSPEATPRHALSKRIGNVGVIGQNIGLGHRLGVCTDDATLTPKKVTLETTEFVITEDSPVQLDIRWSKPDNASIFATLIYIIEAYIPGDNDIVDDLLDENDGWVQIASVRFPTFRIYHTDDKVFIGKRRVMRRDDDVTIELRVCCHGELILPEGTRHWTTGSHSKTAEVTFAGYVTASFEVEQTSL